MSLWWCIEQRHDVLQHPGRAHLGSELVEYFRVITEEDKDEVNRCHLNDVETMDALRDPGFWHDLSLCKSEEASVGRLLEMEVVDDRSGHGSDAMAPALSVPGGGLEPPTSGSKGRRSAD